MRVTLLPTRPETYSSLALLVGKDAPLPERDLVAAAAKMARFDGEAGTLIEHVYANGTDAQRVLVVGIGKGSIEEYEKAGGALTAKLLTSGETALVIDASGAYAESVARLASGIVLRGWRHDRYRTKLAEKLKPTLDDVSIVTTDPGAEAAWTKAQAIIAGVSLTRELVSEPANIIYPESFVERVRHWGDLGVEIEILDDEAMRALGMGSLLGVGQGSARPSRLLAMRWDGTGGATQTPVVFVGKGVTFDTGGISLKPPAGMEDLKWDMGGAGAVAGAM